MNKIILGLLLAGLAFLISCGDSSTNNNDDVIETVNIGNQIWMKKNLNTIVYRNGDTIRQAAHVADWADAMTKKEGAWCYYENHTPFGTIYGKLYNWYAVTDPRGLAPEGFHIPQKQDWDELIDTLGSKEIAGGKLKETGLTHWSSPNEGATNSSGFTALPGGFKNDRNGFTKINYYGLWWSTTVEDSNYVVVCEIRNNESSVRIEAKLKFMGLSVRCIKDK